MKTSGSPCFSVISNNFFSISSNSATSIFSKIKSLFELLISRFMTLAPLSLRNFATGKPIVPLPPKT